MAAVTRRLLLIAPIFLGLAFIGAAPASAQIIQRSFINLGFEQPNLGGNAACYRILNDALVPGWTTNHPNNSIGGNCPIAAGASGPMIEMWRRSFQGVTAREGTQHAELNAYVPSRLSQNVCLVEGETVGFRFSHRRRVTDPETMNFLIGSTVIAQVRSTLTSGTVVSSHPSATLDSPTAGGGGWQDYTGTLVFAGPSGTTNIGFEAVGGGGAGNFLDAIQVTLSPFVEFTNSSFTTIEGQTVGLPVARILGTVPAGGMDVVITITGGTATHGADYTTGPGNPNPILLHIPAGTYDGTGAASEFALQLTAVVDAILEVSETVLFSIGDATAYSVTSTEECGGSPVAQATWTIQDESPPTATVAKVLTGESVTANNIAEPGEVLTYTVTVTHTGGGPFVNFDFIENIPDGATMTAVTGATGFTTDVAGPATVQLTVPNVPNGGTAEVTIDLTISAPIPLGVTQITNRVSGGDVPPDCANCTVTVPTPPATPTNPPTVSCSTTGNYFNTAYNSSTGGFLASGLDPHWAIALTTTSINGSVPASLSYTAATVVSSKPSPWITSPFSNANWIAHSASGAHSGNLDIFYRYQFNLAPGVDPAGFVLDLTFYADNSVWEVWVNGVAQGVRSNLGATSAYLYGGFLTGNGATASLGDNWQAGLNTLVVHVKSRGSNQGFLTQVESTAVCQPKLTLLKDVVNDDAGTATVNNFVLSATGPATISGVSGTPAVTNVTIPAGTYTLGETPLTGYTASAYSCSIDGGPAEPLTDNELTLVNGQNAICTITNNDEPTLLTLVKDLVIDDGGTAVIDDFTLFADGPTPLSGRSGTPNVTAVPVNPGLYTLSETGPPGYTASPYACSVNGNPAVSGDTITIALGDEVVCTITNDDDTARLTLRKTVVNDDGGNAAANAFILTATGPVTITGVMGEATVTDAVVPAGAYALSETGPAGYTAGTYRCSVNGGEILVSNDLLLAAGDEAICTITNDDIPPNIAILKEIVDETGVTDGFPEDNEFITYRITLTNTGGRDFDYELEDILDPNVTFQSATLGGTHNAGIVTWVLNVPPQDGPTPGTMFVEVTVQVGDIADGQQIANIAKTPTEPPPPCPSAQCVVIPPSPSISSVKTLFSESGVIPGVAEPGETLTYHIELRNIGSLTATYAHRDLLDPNTTFVSANELGVHSGGSPGGQVDWTNLTVPGGTIIEPGLLTLEIVVTVVDPIPVGVSRITNVAYDPTEPPPPPNYCEQVPTPAECAILPTPGVIAISKALVDEGGEIDGVAEPLETLTYEITLTNTGGEATNYPVRDILDPNTDFVDANPAGTYDAFNHWVNWTIPVVPAHDGVDPGVVTITVEVIVAAVLPPGTVQLTNIARQPGDPDPVCPSAQCVVMPAAPQIAKEKVLVAEVGGVLPGVAEPGEQLTYEIRLTNQGGADPAFTVEDLLDPNTDLVTASDTGQLMGAHVSWTVAVPAFGSSVPGEPGQRTLTITVVVDDPLPPGVTQLVNIAREPGELVDCETAPAQCPVIPTAPLVSKSKVITGETGAIAGVAEPGEQLTYTITLTNRGGAAATAYQLVDDYDANVTPVLTDGGTDTGDLIEWNALVVPPQVGTDPGILTLTVVVQVDDPLPPGVTQIVNIVREPDEIVDCTETPAQCPTIQTAPQVTKAKTLFSENGAIPGVAEPGEILTYRIRLTNTGGAADAAYGLIDDYDANVVVTNPGGGADNGDVVEWTGLIVPAQAGATPGILDLFVSVRVDDPIDSGVTTIGNVVYEPGEDPVDCTADPLPPECAVIPTAAQVAKLKELIGETGAIGGVAEPGETLTYRITLTNTGGTDATNYAILDDYDEANVTFDTATDGGTAGGGVVTWTGLTVPAQDVTVLTVTFIVDDPLDPGVTGIGNLVREPDEQVDCTLKPDQCVLVPTAAQILKEKVLWAETGVIPGVAEPGETLTYRITITNSGGTAATGYGLIDDYDQANVTLVLPIPDGGVDDGDVITWQNLVIPAHNGLEPGTHVIEYSVVVDDPIDPGVTGIGNVIREPDEIVDCEATPGQCVTVPTVAQVTRQKVLSLEGGAVAGVAEPGERLTYTITLTNNGGTAETGYDLIDDYNEAVVTVFSADNSGVVGGGVITWTDLVVPPHDGTTAGTLVITVVVDVEDPIDPGVTAIANVIYQPGEVIDCTADPVPPECATIAAQQATILLAKTGEYQDTDGNGYANAGDTILYTFTVTNTGNVPLEDVTPIDAGPTFNGQPAGGTLPLVFDPDPIASPVTLQPDGVQVFTATYTLAQTDIDNAAGLADAVENTATARGYANGNSDTGAEVDSNVSPAVLSLPAAVSDVSIAKLALERQIRIGDQATFVIIVTNNAGSLALGLTVTDTLPIGFRYVDGSARIDGVAVTPIVDGRRVIFEGLAIDGNDEIEIELRTVALSVAGPGTHINTASITNLIGERVAPDATAAVEIVAEAVLNCSDIIGAVFDDTNGNGYQDQGETGLPGVRLSTVRGILVTTDEYGRYSIPCAALPDVNIGSNFILKVDVRTLPTGYALTTDNPEIVRLTAGKVAEVNFGAWIGREVRIDLTAAAFAAGLAQPLAALDDGLHQLIAILSTQRSTLVLTYTARGDVALGALRLGLVEEMIRERWRGIGAPYELVITTQILSP